SRPARAGGAISKHCAIPCQSSFREEEREEQKHLEALIASKSKCECHHSNNGVKNIDRMASGANLKV
ncbi:MAG: hypothetical protein ACTHOC_12705, partial [Luteimonas sp.]